MSGIGFEDDLSKKTLFPAVNDAFNDFQLPDLTGALPGALRPPATPSG